MKVPLTESSVGAVTVPVVMTKSVVEALFEKEREARNSTVPRAEVPVRVPLIAPEPLK